jgi:hypothetical protein
MTTSRAPHCSRHGPGKTAAEAAREGGSATHIAHEHFNDGRRRGDPRGGRRRPRRQEEWGVHDANDCTASGVAAASRARGAAATAVAASRAQLLWCGNNVNTPITHARTRACYFATRTPARRWGEKHAHTAPFTAPRAVAAAGSPSGCGSTSQAPRHHPPAGEHCDEQRCLQGLWPRHRGVAPQPRGGSTHEQRAIDGRHGLSEIRYPCQRLVPTEVPALVSHRRAVERRPPLSIAASPASAARASRRRRRRQSVRPTRLASTPPCRWWADGSIGASSGLTAVATGPPPVHLGDGSSSTTATSHHRATSRRRRRRTHHRGSPRHRCVQPRRRRHQ